MMRLMQIVAACAVAMGGALAQAGDVSITGEYLESRTCDVYTGPCFANGDISLAGREAVMAWKVDSGSWAGQDVSGLGVALVVKGNDTLGFGGSFTLFNPDPIKSVILVDENATESQKTALVDFVKSNAPKLTKDVERIDSAKIELTNDHVTGKATFTAGKVAKIETRGLKKGDCICSNEVVFYPPLTNIENSHPVYTLNMSYEGKGLAAQWTLVNRRSAFMGTFSK